MPIIYGRPPISQQSVWDEQIMVQEHIQLNQRQAIFTDGTFQNGMGRASVYLSPNHPYNITIEVSQADSSTEVELIALIYVLVHTPSQAKIIIVTDNLANVSLLKTSPKWYGALSWLQNYFQWHNTRREQPLELIHIYSHQAEKLQHRPAEKAELIWSSNEKFGDKLETFIAANEMADEMTSSPPETQFQGVICPNRRWQMTHHSKQKPWNVRSIVTSITDKLRRRHQQQILPTAKAVPKDWSQIDLEICRLPDPDPEGCPPGTDPSSFIQSPGNGGRHFLQLRMGSIRLKGHKGGHMTHRKFTKLQPPFNNSGICQIVHATQAWTPQNTEYFIAQSMKRGGIK